MADRETVECAKAIAEKHYGKPLTLHRRVPKGRMKQPFFEFNMVAKKPLYAFLRSVLPWLRVKRTEALLSYDFCLVRRWHGT